MIVRFDNLDFQVLKNTFVPYSETEFLVSECYKILRKIKPIGNCFADMSTGCGNIAITLLTQFPKLKCIASDVSVRTLDIAKINAKYHKVLERIVFKESNLFENYKPIKLDLIVANLPYIDKEHAKEIIDVLPNNPPIESITDNNDGLDLIKVLVEDSPKFLNSNGYLLFEFAKKQEQEVRQLFDKSTWKNIEILSKDFMYSAIAKVQKI